MRRLLPSILGAAILLTAAPVALAANPTPPAITNANAENVERTTATFAGSVDPNGADTTYHYEYGTTTGYGLVTPNVVVPNGDDPVPVKVNVAGLTENTTYHYRLVATNAAGVTNGADRTVKTDAAPAAPRAPAVSTSPARDVRPTTATLVARVNPRGQSTTFYFQYGTTTAVTSRTPSVAAGSGTSTGTVTAAVRDLKINTRYYFRVVAVNATGTTRGGTRNFTTLRAPTGVSLSASSRAVVWNGAITVAGRIAGGGVGGAPVALERSDFPFLTGFREVARQNADKEGDYRFSVGPLYSAVRLRVVTRTTVAAASAPVQINNRVSVGVKTIGGNRRSVALSGVVNPAVPNGRISVQRQTAAGAWIRVKRAKPQALTGNRSRYRVRVNRTRRAAKFRVVVIPNDQGEHVNGVTRELRIAKRKRR
ncbi:MAG: fibronectin type III domain-containing protein [Solirubrobacteraceae bacterium]|nr:fibronectin type III domain-containing protein [Solirubrobacteraceae bacterium]